MPGVEGPKMRTLPWTAPLPSLAQQEASGSEVVSIGDPNDVSYKGGGAKRALVKFQTASFQLRKPWLGPSWVPATVPGTGEEQR